MPTDRAGQDLQDYRDCFCDSWRVHADPLSEIETPAVLVDRERVQRNVDWAQSVAESRGVALRPHVKTHKCVEIARMQLAHGAAGLTASKVDEALVFIEAGVRSITVAYPLVDERKIRRLLAGATRRGTELRVVVDSRTGAELLARVAADERTMVGAFLEIDVGLRRCGLREDDPGLLELVEFLRGASHLRFVGLLSHAGHAYGAADAREVAAIAADECAILRRVRGKLERGGVHVPEVSVGSTPTVLASDTYEGITEIRPGNYVFMDRTPLRLGLAGMDDMALTVLATVVSRNADYLIIDAGSKVLTSDRGAHGTAGAVGFGVAFAAGDAVSGEAPFNVARLSEEHGFVERAGRDIAIGTKLRIVPNHACPVVNLARELVVVSGQREVGRWRVAARGSL